MNLNQSIARQSGREVVVYAHTNHPNIIMPPKSTNNPLIISIIVIGIILVIMLLSRRGGYTGGQTYYRGNMFTASALPIDFGRYTNDSVGTYTRTVAYPKPTTQSFETVYSYYPTTTTYTTYQQTEPHTQYYDYTNQYYPEQNNLDQYGCSPYANYSVTTGYNCR